MEKNEQNEIDLSHVFRVLLNKLWIILIATIAGAVVGGAFGYFRYRDKHYYGATVNYDISIVTYIDGVAQDGTNYSYKEEHLSRMVEQLQSDAFMEQLMSGIENAPKKEDGSSFNAYVSALRGTLSFSYNPNNLNSLYVSVSVLNNETFAQTVLDRVRVEVPEYVEKKMIIPAQGNFSYETVCEELSRRDTAVLLNGGNASRQALKFGLIVGAAAFLIACVAVVIVDSSDKRLRDYQKFSERYGVTVLGVIPRLEKKDQKDTEVTK